MLTISYKVFSHWWLQKSDPPPQAGQAEMSISSKERLPLPPRRARQRCRYLQKSDYPFPPGAPGRDVDISARPGPAACLVGGGGGLASLFSKL